MTSLNLGNSYRIDPKIPSSCMISPGDGWSSPAWNVANPDVLKSFVMPQFSIPQFQYSMPRNNMYNFSNNLFSGMPNQSFMMPNQFFPNQTFGMMGQQNWNAFSNPQFAQGALPQQQNMGMDMTAMMKQCLQMMFFMKALNAQQQSAATPTATAEEPKPSIEEKPEATSESTPQESSEEKDTSKKIQFNSKKPLASIQEFLQNTDDDTTLKYVSFKKFADSTFAKLGGKDGNPIALTKFFKTYGINLAEISDDKREELKDKLGDGDTDLDSIKIDFDKYKTLLNELGIESGKTEISRKEFQEHIDTFKEKSDTTKKASPDKAESEPKIAKSEVDEKFDKLNTLVGKTTLNSNDIDEIKSIIKSFASSDKRVLTMFLDKLNTSDTDGLKGTKTPLGAILAGIIDSNGFFTLNSTNMASFENDILFPLKSAVNRHNLKDKWNQALDTTQNDVKNNLPSCNEQIARTINVAKVK